MGSSVVVVLHSYSLAEREVVCQHPQHLNVLKGLISLYKCLPLCYFQ